MTTGTDERAATAAEALRGRLAGMVHLPGEGAYERARLTFSALVDNRPAVLVHCRSADDVAAGVDAATAVGLPVSVRRRPQLRGARRRRRCAAARPVGPAARRGRPGPADRPRRGRRAVGRRPRRHAAAGLAVPCGTFGDPAWAA